MSRARSPRSPGVIVPGVIVPGVILLGVIVLGVTGGVGGAAAFAGAAPEVPPPSTPPATAPPSTAPPPGPADEGGAVDGALVDPAVQPPVTLPLVPVPAGCAAPALPHIVFVGRVRARDYRTVKFEIEQIRAGQAAPFAREGLIDVRYGLDAQYLDDGARYLVSAPVHPDLGLLVSNVAPRPQDFGGDEVIGVAESDVDCPRFDDPTRTMHLDGTAIEAPLLAPLFGAKARLLAAIVVPTAIGVLAIFVLATLRLAAGGAYRSIAAVEQRHR